MGKKTDKFTSNLTTIGEACEDLLTKLSAANDRMLQNNADWSRTVGAMGAPFEKVQTDREQIWAVGKKLCIDLQSKLNELNSAIAEFDKYITKKSKSKNPFKSKKSIPAAQDTIRVYRQFVSATEEILGIIRFESFR